MIGKPSCMSKKVAFFEVDTGTVEVLNYPRPLHEEQAWLSSEHGRGRFLGWIVVVLDFPDGEQPA
jgi:hypothetical protein